MPCYILVWNTENKHYSLKPTTERAANTQEGVLTGSTRGYNIRVCKHVNRILYLVKVKEH